ncbi:MAG: Hsp20/alpha crystallin family protein [Acidobacteriota bacterium]
MANIVRRRPGASMLSSFGPRMTAFDRLFDQEILRPFRMLEEMTESLGQRGWAPPVDIRETEEAYEVMADLPGFDKENVDITLENNVLTLRGERAWEGDQGEQSYRRIERAYGEFTRSFSLPSQVDAEKVDATFKDGVLTVTIPKSAESRPRRIAVK